MAKTTDLPIAGATDGSELVAVVQGGTSKRMALRDMSALADPYARLADLQRQISIIAGTRTAPYVGQVTTRCFINNLINAPATQSMSRSYHLCRSAVTAIQVEYYYGYNNSAANYSEGIPAGAGTMKLFLEKMDGTLYGPFLYGGSPTGPMQAGGYLLSDALKVPLAAGEAFWLKPFMVLTAAGMPYMSTRAGTADQLYPGEGSIQGTAVADQTGSSGALVGASIAGCIYPTAIVGITTRASFLLIGDSRVAGAFDSTAGSSNGDVGELARSIGPTHAYINAGVSGDRAVYAVTFNTLRRHLSSYVSHVILEPGINDLANGATAASLLGDRANLISQYPRKTVIQSTIPPATDAGNTAPLASNAPRQTVNTAIRATPGYIEVADQVEGAGRTGLWKAGDNADGYHENPTGYAAIAASGTLNPEALSQIRAPSLLWTPWEMIPSSLYVGTWIMPDDAGTTLAYPGTLRAHSATATFSQSTASKQPALAAGVIGGLAGLMFDGVDDVLVGDAGMKLITNAAPALTVAGVYKPLGATGFAPFFFKSTNDSSTKVRASIFWDATTKLFGIYARRLDTDAVVLVAGTTQFNPGTPVEYVAEFNPTAGTMSLELNGKVEGAGVYASAGAFPATSSNTVQLGGGGGAGFANGCLGEFVELPRVLTADERTRIRGYLAWRYGLAGSLRASDPYRSAAPLVALV